MALQETQKSQLESLNDKLKAQKEERDELDKKIAEVTEVERKEKDQYYREFPEEKPKDPIEEEVNGPHLDDDLSNNAPSTPNISG